MNWRLTIGFLALTGGILAGECFFAGAARADDNANQADKAGSVDAEKAETGHEGDKAHPKDGEAHAKSHGGAHHDETDLSHMNATPKLEDLSELRYDLAIWTFVVFLSLMALLVKFAWRPIMEGLDKREQGIASLVEQARENAERSAALLQQHEQKLAAAADETRELLATARKDADALRERIVAEAESAAQRERDRAVADIQGAKNAALQEMTQRSVDLAFHLAGGLVKRQLNREDHNQLIREALDKFGSVN